MYKALNIVFLSIALSLLGGFLIGSLSTKFFGEFGSAIAIPASLFLGFNSRRLVEKFLGYTIEQSLKESMED